MEFKQSIIKILKETKEIIKELLNKKTEDGN